MSTRFSFSLTDSCQPISYHNPFCFFLQDAGLEEPLREDKGTVETSSRVAHSILDTSKEQPCPAPLRFNSFSLNEVLPLVNNKLEIKERGQHQREERGAEIERNLGELTSQIQPVIDKIESFAAEIKTIEEQYRKWKLHADGIENLQGNLLAFLEYFDVNYDNLLEVLNHRLITEDYEFVKDQLTHLDKTFKWTNCIAPLVFNVTKYCIGKQIQQNLEKHQKKLQDLKHQIAAQKFNEYRIISEKIKFVQTHIELLGHKIEKEQKEALDKSQTKSGKLASRGLTIPLEYRGLPHTQANRIGKCCYGIYKQTKGWLTGRSSLQKQKKWVYLIGSFPVVNIAPISHAQLYQEAESLLDALKTCTEIKKVKQLLQAENIEIEVPASFEEWVLQFNNPHFKDRLVQCYVRSHIRNSSCPRFSAFQKQPNPEVQAFLNLLTKCTSIEEVKQTLKAKRIKIEIPTGFKEWTIKLNHPNFKHVLAQNYGSVKAKDFLNSLETCTSIKEVKQILKAKRIEIEVPSILDEWVSQFNHPRFKEYLVQSYYYAIGSCPVQNIEDIQALLHKRLTERNEKIGQKFNSIYHHIQECQNLEFSEIRAYFNQLHIHLDPLIFPQDIKFNLKNKQEWDACVLNPQFVEALTAQWVDYQEATAQLTLQMLRQALLSRNSVEREFLHFRGVEHIASFISSIVQLVLCFAPSKIWLASSILELFVKDLAKLGVPGVGLLNIFHPMFPEMDIKLMSIIMMLAEHFFAIKYKPNEYSLEGYKLVFQIRWLGFVIIAHYLVALLEQISLWLKTRLVENCIMGLQKKPLEADPRFIQLNEKYEQQRLICNKNIKVLKDYLSKLKIKDANLHIQPHGQHQGSENQKERIEPIQNLAEVLKDVDFGYFPPEVHQFFEENFGFQLTEANKPRLQENLERFLSANEDELIETYEENHQVYLRAQ